MRTKIRIPLRPSKHLQPCLAFLSGQRVDELKALDQQAARLIREKSLIQTAPARRKAAEATIQRIRERVLRLVGANLVGKEFPELHAQTGRG